MWRSNIRHVKTDPSPLLPGLQGLVTDRNDPGAETLPWSRKLLALLIALAVDAPPLCLLGESLPIIFDVAVAGVLWLVLGRSRLLAMALLVECIPGVGLAPTWSIYVLWEIIFSRSKPGGQPTTPPPLIGKPQE